MRSVMKKRRFEELGGEEMWFPDEIVYLIISKLIEFPTNLARFSAVCKQWHRLVCNVWSRAKLVKQHEITPLFLVPIDDEEGEGVNKQASCRIYSLRGRCVPAPVNSLACGFNRIIGSSFGWLILVADRSVLLFNPLSKSHIRLPPLHHLDSDSPPVKGVLSKMPRPGQHIDIAITMNPCYGSIGKSVSTIAFLHVDKMGAVDLESLQWVYHHRPRNDILDVNSIGGRICILYTRGCISCCKCTTDRFCYYDAVVKEWPQRIQYHHRASVYLVESSSSEPLVVFRYKDNTSSSSRPTVGFKIMTLKSNDNREINAFNKTWNWTERKTNAMQQYLSDLKWAEIKTLGNDVIFLSKHGNSICFQCPKLAATGSIYFSQGTRTKGTHFGVFHIDQNCLTHHRLDHTNFLPQGPPIWIYPCYDEILRFSSIG